MERYFIALGIYVAAMIVVNSYRGYRERRATAIKNALELSNLQKESKANMLMTRTRLYKKQVELYKKTGKHVLLKDISLN